MDFDWKIKHLTHKKMGIQEKYVAVFYHSASARAFFPVRITLLLVFSEFVCSSVFPHFRMSNNS